MRRHEVVYRLSSERKMIDLEGPLNAILKIFNAEICFGRRFHWILLPRFRTKIRKSTIR